MSGSVDRRVQIVIELLRKQESLPPSNLHTNGSYHEKDSKEISMDELTRLVKLSVGQLYALFNRDVGIPPMRYVRLLKMENAIKLAENTSLTIERIVEIVGGGDVSHFQRDVKKTFGKTLGEFRRLRLQQFEKERGA